MAFRIDELDGPVLQVIPGPDGLRPSPDEVLGALDEIERRIQARPGGWVIFLDSTWSPPPDALTRKHLGAWTRRSEVMQPDHVRGAVVLVTGRVTELALEAVMWFGSPRIPVEIVSSLSALEQQVAAWTGRESWSLPAADR